jgi:chromate transporter
VLAESDVKLPSAIAAPFRRVSFREALGVWTRIGFLSFGGPAGQIALMHRELVEKRRWLDEERFMHALSYCMLLPGPEAQQLAIYIGWLLHKTRGGLLAGILFVLPGSLAVLLLSALYASLGRVPAIAALFFGLKAAVLAIVIEAVKRIGKRALISRWHLWLAAGAFVSLFCFGAPFPLVVLAAGLIGLWLPSPQPTAKAHTVVSSALVDPATTLVEQLARAGELGHTLPSKRRALRVLALGLSCWALPLLAVRAVFGAESVFHREGVFFSQAAMLTFGGAYAALSFVAERAVNTYGWLMPGEMLDGLGLAETTPGPLILVLELVGFLAAYRHPGGLPPLVAGTLGAAITLWATFVPCFLWIFLGGPHVEALRGNRRLRSALSGITAAVVGVILNLSIWFGCHVLFRHVETLSIGPLHVLVPTLSSLDIPATCLAAVALLAVFRFELSVPKVLGLVAALGLFWKLTAGA